MCLAYMSTYLTFSCGGFEMGHTFRLRYVWFLRCGGVRAVRDSGRHEAIWPILRPVRLLGYLVSRLIGAVLLVLV